MERESELLGSLCASTVYFIEGFKIYMENDSVVNKNNNSINYTPSSVKDHIVEENTINTIHSHSSFIASHEFASTADFTVHRF